MGELFIGSEGLQQTQSTQNSHTVNAATQDIEFSGLLNRASNQGAKFALLLAMLQQDVLARPNIGQAREPESQEMGDVPTYYPETHLQAHAQDWLLADTASDILHHDGIRSAQLWLVMHPQPLSLHNDPYYIDDEIYANCDTYTQARYSKTTPQENSEITVDETGIFDLLEEIGLKMQA